MTVVGPRSVRPRLALPVAALCAAAFAALAAAFGDDRGPALDRTLALDLHRHRVPALTDALRALTQLGGYAVTAAAAIALAAWLWRRRGEVRAALFVAAAIGGAMALGVVAKAAFDRPRPRVWAAEVPTLGSSFPSAHAMNSAALVAAVLVLARGSRWFRPLAAGGCCLVLLVGVTRVWLGAHYPTDVAAGWLLSVALVLALAAAVRPSQLRG
jgi:undecaprenyl-diphosphatase